MNLFLSIQNLFHWSQNFSFPSPASVFLDLVGYSEEEYGERLVQGDISSILGYRELNLLGLALQEYADDPGRADDMIRFLLFCEAEGLDPDDEENEDTCLAMNDFIPWYLPSTSVLVAA